MRRLFWLNVATVLMVLAASFAHAKGAMIAIAKMTATTARVRGDDHVRDS
jgi:hypothetical protein